jgi:hypothetical protein
MGTLDRPAEQCAVPLSRWQACTLWAGYSLLRGVDGVGRRGSPTRRLHRPRRTHHPPRRARPHQRRRSLVGPRQIVTVRVEAHCVMTPPRLRPKPLHSPAHTRGPHRAGRHRSHRRRRSDGRDGQSTVRPERPARRHREPPGCGGDRGLHRVGPSCPLPAVTGGRWRRLSGPRSNVH